MAETTGISWCDATFNPWVGCSKVSPGCAHCYAETLVTGRMGRPGTWGETGVRQRTTPANWRKPLTWAKTMPEKLGRRPRVFCASLADVFEPRPELDPWRNDLFELIEATQELDWLILTKRPDHARDWLNEWYAETLAHFPTLFANGANSNLWIGTSIENSRFTWRADALREIPAAVRFVSAEPLLGSLFATRMTVRTSELGERWNAPAPLDLTGIDWLIVGGESGGPRSRPARIEWVRELRDAAQEAGTVFHFKQWGSHDQDGVYRGAAPTSGGKILDGVEWCDFPEPTRTRHLTLA